MSDIVLTVEGLTKKYTIGENRERYVAMRDVLVRKARQSVKTLGAIGGNGSRESTPPDNEIYALRDVSFELAKACPELCRRVEKFIGTPVKVSSSGMYVRR